ncbi:ead/Ea22-like family protein [Citrobacter freundii]|uniref:ead/Ea22-like family protein n=1 Tax=Citrobacter freundii TaxID=546 RepID=UPI003CEA0B3D
MSNIDKRALREAAEKALPAMQRLLMMPNDELFDEALLNVDGDVDAANAFNLLTEPETMLALLDELEKEKGYASAYEGEKWHYHQLAESEGERANRAEAKLEAAEKRIAELEARTVTVKLPADYRNSDGNINADMFNTCEVVGAFRDALAAAGIGVKGE